MSRAGGVAHPRQRIVLCGGAYSDNFGDGIIADCLEYGLRRQVPEMHTVKMDISGRLDHGDGGFGQKAGTQRLLKLIPHAAGRYVILLAGSLYVKRVVEPNWRRIIEPHDAVVVGGGQLFQDEHLNFPVKMWQLGRTLRRNNCQTLVYAVGVDRNWSPLGRRLFLSMFRNAQPTYCSVRDDASKRNLLTHVPYLRSGGVEIDPDPALLADATYGVSRASSSEFDVGIGIMDPWTLRVDVRQKNTDVTAVARRWSLLIGALLDADLSVALFTNGAREDEDFVRRLHRDVGRRPRLAVLERPGSAAAYVANLSRMHCVLAHRLHASIVSYALGIPSLGLRWDPKVESFYSLCEREEWVVDFATRPVDELAAKVQDLLRASLDPAVRAAVIAQCDAGVERLAAQLRSLS
ncbi:MAG TPA: polysaccharide pyruvyl transferase family protein [Solirubrobacteraceae bacterium]|nr:polysaccharide pyruvyl transferase family protein [Solirubrobacteraceae bacterium]